MGYLIGIDGGATKTAAVLADEQGTILHRVTVAASNYHAVGKQKAGQALAQAVEQVVAGAGKSLADCRMAVFGLAGLNNSTDQQIFDELVAAIGLTGDVRVENDIVIAWAAATQCQPGVVVIAGTGASAFGVDYQGNRYKSLGWDYIISDQGSGYWVGLQGLQAAVKAWDGRYVEGGQLLMDAMLDHYQQPNMEAAIAHIYSDDFLADMKTEVASFSRRVSQCANQGDKIAQQILQHAGEELGDGACAVIRHLHMENEAIVVGQIGSTFNSGAYLEQAFASKVYSLAPEATIKRAEYRAQVGALIYGYQALGMLTDELLERLPKRDEMDD